MRLNKFVAVALGIGRRPADKLISQGAVTINGQVALLGATVKQNDLVAINGCQVAINTNFTYILLNKPIGYVCSHQGQGSPTIYELLPPQYGHLKLGGRLDKDSSGLMILSDDGQLIYGLTHPSNQKTKIYEVILNKKLSNTDIATITSEGVTLSDGMSKFCVEPLISKNCSWKYRVIMHEGRNRQIRRTFKALGYEVTKLHRTQIGSYKIGNIKSGHFLKTA